MNTNTVGAFTLTGGSCQELYGPNATLYHHTCDVSIKTFTLTIKHVKKNNLNDEWDCSVRAPVVSIYYIRSNIVKPRVIVFISSINLTLPLTSTLSINENTLLQFRCVTSGGLPEPTVKWYNDSRTPSAPSDDIEITSAIKTSYSNTSDYLIKTTSTLTFVPSKFDNSISIYCTAYSSSDQTPLVSTRKPKLDVLYPPVVDDLKNRSIIEGASLTIVCPVTVGNPPETTFIWRADDDREWRKQDLAIDNVTRNDSMYYSCEVANILKQTGQPDTSTKPDNGATVTDFYVSDYAGETSITVNEGTTVSLNCDVDSNPGSMITIQFQTEGHELLRVVNTKYLEYILSASTCIDAGIYLCLASNQYNNKQSVKQLRLYVKCLPRPSPTPQLKENIRVAQHQEAVITFTTVAYPEPTKNDFKWFKWNNLQWISLINSVAYQTDTLGLQSNLTVKNVDKTSYGKYKLLVTNAIGNHVCIFNLLPEGKPEDPIGFKTLQEIVTETTFTVQWKPGFDNGPQQKFVLKYKKSPDIDWKSVLVSDTGEAQMIYTVTGLSKGTEYQVAIYASNKWGNSSESEILLLRTKDGPTENNCHEDGNTAIIVGVVLGLVIGALAGYASCVTILFKRKQENQGQPSSSHVVHNAGNTSTYANLAYTPNTSEMKQNSPTLEDAPILGVADYTTLEEQLRDNRSTYNVINAVS
ncbi:nephrin-like isoform X2 [Mercenaria mercenaria]|uniref:nephrin-like isoform X2 n=1 Tax=Mercenaria mercenaria TaxID=6596 RepID=UPI00234E7D78|nr:nephrin-like isoform X2 [Mercenaria mercenaria]